MDITEEVLGLIPFSTTLKSGRQLIGDTTDGQQQQQQQHDATTMTSSGNAIGSSNSDGMNFPSKLDLDRMIIDTIVQQQHQYGDGDVIDDHDDIDFNDYYIRERKLNEKELLDRDLESTNGINTHRQLQATKITKNADIEGTESTITIAAVVTSTNCRELGQLPSVDFNGAVCIAIALQITILPGNAGWTYGAEDQIDYALRGGFYTTKLGFPFILNPGDPFLSTNFIPTSTPVSKQNE